MRIGNLTLERSKGVRHAGPVDIETTRWKGHMGSRRWSHARPTKVHDKRSEESNSVKSLPRAVLRSMAGAAAATTGAWLLRKMMRNGKK